MWETWGIFYSLLLLMLVFKVEYVRLLHIPLECTIGSHVLNTGTGINIPPFALLLLSVSLLQNIDLYPQITLKCKIIHTNFSTEYKKRLTCYTYNCFVFSVNTWASSPASPTVSTSLDRMSESVAAERGCFSALKIWKDLPA